MFTKDVVYVKGLLDAHTFLLVAARAGRFDLARVLFAGRMTLGDALALAPLMGTPTLSPPAVVPPWVAAEGCLAAQLTWAAFHDRIRLDGLGLEDFWEG